MKFRRGIALLLATLMVLMVLPITALAADMSWTWTVTVFGGNYYKYDGTQSTTNKYTINRYLDNSKPHEIGYKFEWNASAGGSVYNGGWQLCLTVDDQIVERSTAYIYTRNMADASGTWTAPSSSHTGNSSHPFNVYLNSYPSVNTAPTKPSDSDVASLLGRIVEVSCLNDTAGHGSNVYNLIAGSYSVSAVSQVGSGYTCTVTIAPAKYVTQYNADKGVEHTLDPATQGSKTVTLTWNASSSKWQANLDGFVRFTVVCETPAPNAPTADELKTIFNGKVVVDCTNEEVSHADGEYGLLEGGYVLGTVTKGSDGAYTYTVTISPDKYVTKYNTDTGATHTLSPDTQTGKTVTLKYVDKKWTAADSDLPVKFTVVCETPAPNAPTPNELKAIFDNNIIVDCTNKEVSHADGEYAMFSYNTGTVTKGTDGVYTCSVTIEPAAYVVQYNKDTSATHTLSPDTQTGKTVTLKYVDKKWTAADSDLPVKFTVVCETPAPDAPTADELKAIFDGQVVVDCVNDKANHADKTYGLLKNSYTVSEVKKDQNGYYVEVTVKPNAYVSKYNEDTGKTHRLTEQGSRVVKVYYISDQNEAKWDVSADELPITFKVTCKTRVIDDSKPNASNPGSLVPGDSNPNTGAHSSVRSAVQTLLLAAVSGFSGFAVANVLKKKESDQ